MPKVHGFDDPKYRGNPKMIAKYLNVAFATGDQALATKAIGDMVRAQGMSRFSRKVGLRREGLYRSFSGNMGPGFDTVMKVLGALHIKIVAKPANVADPKLSRSPLSGQLTAANVEINSRKTEGGGEMT